MGKIIAIIGNCGSGKTTLANLLGERLGYRLLLEQHFERPYQRAFMQDRQVYGLPNQGATIQAYNNAPWPQSAGE